MPMYGCLCVRLHSVDLNHLNNLNEYDVSVCAFTQYRPRSSPYPSPYPSPATAGASAMRGHPCGHPCGEGTGTLCGKTRNDNDNDKHLLGVEPAPASASASASASSASSQRGANGMAVPAGATVTLSDLVDPLKGTNGGSISGGSISGESILGDEVYPIRYLVNILSGSYIGDLLYTFVYA